MSAEKWESVTWDWIERELVDYILIASKEPGKAAPFLNLLAKASGPAGSSQSSRTTEGRSTSNG